MPFTTTSDDYEDDCWSLSDAAYRLHHDGLTWVNRKLLDMRMPKEDMRRMKRPEAVQELLDAEFWTDEGDHYRIRHQARYQKTREQVLRFQESRRKNGAKGGRPRKDRSPDLPPPTTREQWAQETPGTYEKPSSFSAPGNLRGSGTGSGRGNLSTTQGEVEDQTRLEEEAPTKTVGWPQVRTPPIPSPAALPDPRTPWPVEDPPEDPWAD